MKKALIICYNDLNNSGVPNVIYQSIKALSDQYCFDILTFGDDDSYYRKLQGEGISINLIKYTDSKPSNKLSRLFWWFFKNPRDHYLFMKKLLMNNNYSVIHSFKENDSWPFFKAAAEVGVKKRIFHRNVNPVRSSRVLTRLLDARNLRRSVKYSSELVGVSELCCQNAFSGYQYTVLHNCYNESKYNINVSNHLLNDELVITQVGSFSENKNQLFSLQILVELKKLHLNAKLNLVGANGITQYYQQLLDFVKKNGLEDSVSFIDKTDGVEKIYEFTSFTIIPSLREGFSLAAIEAQACGIEVFASSSIPKEVDCGGVVFLDLLEGAKYWATEIYQYYLKHVNKRFRFNMNAFRFESFKHGLNKLYSLADEDGALGN